MEKLVAQWIDDALNARDHNVSVPALVDKLFATCHRTGGDAAVVQDECFACRSYRTEGAEKAFQAQVAEFAQLQLDVRGSEENLRDAEEAAAVVQRQLKVTQDELEAARKALFVALAEAKGLNAVAERRAIEVLAANARRDDAMSNVQGLELALKAARTELKRIRDILAQVDK